MPSVARGPCPLGSHPCHRSLQLGDFAENLQHQISRLVVEPMREYHGAIGAALRQARTFDDESDALDAAHLKYLALSRDSPVETRAHAHTELCDRAAGVALSLFDSRCVLRETIEKQQIVPQRALAELLVAQLAYHQSCTRLLTALMPQVSEMLAAADGADAALQQQREAAASERGAMPQPQLRDGSSTLIEGWLYKGAFNLSNEPESVKSHVNRLKPWNKRWFVLCDDGKLYYYKAPEDAKQAKVARVPTAHTGRACTHWPRVHTHTRTLRARALCAPVQQSSGVMAATLFGSPTTRCATARAHACAQVPIDMNMLTSVAAVNGPLELELRLGKRSLRLKALETVDRERWMAILNSYLTSHEAEREAATALNQRRYQQLGMGIRDLDAKSSKHSRTSVEGWLYRQDSDMLRRCVGPSATCTWPYRPHCRAPPSLPCAALAAVCSPPPFLCSPCGNVAPRADTLLLLTRCE